MTQTLELANMEFKIIMIEMIGILIEKVDSIQNRWVI